MISAKQVRLVPVAAASTFQANCTGFCSAYESSMEALQQPTIRVVAVIAEGVPEQDTKKLICYARAHNKIILGPATVGGLQVRTLSMQGACTDLMA